MFCKLREDSWCRCEKPSQHQEKLDEIVEEGQKSAIVYDTRDVFIYVSTVITRMGESV